MGEANLGKVVSQGDLILHRSEWKRNGKSVAFVSGTFDLLHPGHVRLLEQAHDLADVLIVGVASDASTSARRPPITPAAERMEILAALAAVDYVVEYDEPAPAKLLALLDPDVIVEGAAAGSRSRKSHKAHKSVPGPKLRAIPLEPGYSTTQLIKRIKQFHA